jgi:hypothetical protein
VAVRRLSLANIQLAGRTWEEVSFELQRFLEVLNDMFDDEVASPTAIDNSASIETDSPAELKPHVHTINELVGLIDEVRVLLATSQRPHDHYPPDPADAQTILAGQVFGG